MARFTFAAVVIGLIGGTAWAASGAQAERQRLGAGVGLVLVAALQR